jgi:hypothetical protein
VSCFTRDGNVAREFSRRIQVGMVGINVPIPVPMAWHGFRRLEEEPVRRHARLRRRRRALLHQAEVGRAFHHAALAGEHRQGRRVRDAHGCGLKYERKRNGQPVFLFTEGVLMYLEPQQVQAMLATFGERAPAGSVLAFDAMCWLAIGRAAQHPSVRATGAEFRWGLRRTAELTQAHPRLRLDSTYRVLEGMGPLYTLFAPLVLMLLGVPLYAVYALSAVDQADT